MYLFQDLSHVLEGVPQLPQEEESNDKITFVVPDLWILQDGQMTLLIMGIHLQL